MIDNTIHQDLPEGNNPGGENNGQDPWELIMNQVLKAQKKYPCENEDCVTLNVSFCSQEDLNSHVKRAHHCSFIHMNAEVLYNHTLSHRPNNTDYVCKVCSKIFGDQAQLNNHMAQARNLSCVVCHSSNFTNRQALTDHSKNCNLANLDEKVGPPNILGVSTESSTMSLLLKALSESKMMDIPAHTLGEIKSLEIEQNQIKKTPELYLKKTRHPFGCNCF